MNHLQEIQQLKYNYCYAMDSNNLDEVLEQFTEDAYYELPMFGQAQGHAEISDILRDVFSSASLAFMSHLVVNPIIDIQENSAQGKWYYLTLIKTKDETTTLSKGFYDDEYEFINDAWKISSLNATREISEEL